MAEVLFVLLENAAKYSPKETTISLSAFRDGPGVVRVAIEDQGPGIPDRLREQVFDKFFRAMSNGDLAKQKPGSGMGLAIAQSKLIDAEGRTPL